MVAFFEFIHIVVWIVHEEKELPILAREQNLVQYGIVGFIFADWTLHRVWDMEEMLASEAIRLLASWLPECNNSHLRSLILLQFCFLKVDFFEFSKLFHIDNRQIWLNNFFFKLIYLMGGNGHLFPYTSITRGIFLQFKLTYFQLYVKLALRPFLFNIGIVWIVE